MKRRLGAGLVAVWLAVAAVAQQAAPAFVAVDLPTTALWVGQRIEVVVRIGHDAAFFAEKGVPLFQRRLDLPFQIVVPWLGEHAGRAVELIEDTSAAGSRLAVGDRDARATPAGRAEHDGRTFEQSELRFHLTMLTAGEHAVQPVVLRYAFTTRYEQNLLSGRQPVDRHDGSVASAPQRLVASALPAGAPAGFSGAVGAFAVRAAVLPTEVEIGGAVALELTVTGDGDGDLHRFAAPPWPELDGFVVQGLVEKRTAQARTFVFDLLAVRVVTAVPPIGFSYFDPAAGVYRAALTAPVPLRVLPMALGREVSGRVQALLLADAATMARARAWPWPYYAVLGAVVLVVLTGPLQWRRRARRRAGLEQAVQGLAAQLQLGPDAARAAFEACCAACAGGGGAFAGEPAWSKIEAAGAPAALVARARAIHAALAAARYGGTMPVADAVLDVARQIARAVR